MAHGMAGVRWGACSLDSTSTDIATLEVQIAGCFSPSRSTTVRPPVLPVLRRSAELERLTLARRAHDLFGLEADFCALQDGGG